MYACHESISEIYLCVIDPINLEDEMYKCEQCGKEVLLPFDYICCFCRKAFCSEHRLAENHRCLHLPYVAELKERQKPETLKSRKSVSRILAFCMILTLLGAIITCTSYQFGYEIELRDPTYQEALQFIKSDHTDKHQYDKEKYTCVDFAKNFRDNALKAGYRCGYVVVYFPATGHLTDLIDRPNSITNWSHALNCFNTTDCGLTFIEPQKDEIVTLTCGQPYWDRTKYFQPAYNDTVIEFRISW